MQVEPLLVSNNASSLTTPTLLEAGAAGAVGLAMDLLGGASSIPQVLQPGLAFHAPFSHLDGHVTNCGQGSAGAEKSLQEPACEPESARRMTDWPPGWHPHPDCPAIAPQSVPDAVDLSMAGDPQLPAASPALPASSGAEAAMCAGVSADANGLTSDPHPQPSTDQEMPDADAVRGGDDAIPSRKRSAAEMQSSGSEDCAAECDGEACAARTDALPGSGCGTRRYEDQLPAGETAGPNPVDSGSNRDAGVHGSTSEGVEGGREGRQEDDTLLRTDDSAGSAADHQMVEPGPGVEGSEAGSAAAAAAADTRGVEPLGGLLSATCSAEGSVPLAGAVDADGAAGCTSAAPSGEAANAAASGEQASAGSAGAAGVHGTGTETASTSGTATAATGVAVTDTLALELRQIIAHCGGVADTRHAGRLAALVEGEERLGGRLTLLTVVQQSSHDVLRQFVQGSGLRSLERWVIQLRDDKKHPALIKVIGCLKILPIDLNALKGSSIGQTVGKLRKHTNPEVRTAASELVDHWKSVVDRSVGKGEARQSGTKSKADGTAQDGPNKRPRKQADASGQAAATAGGTGSSGKHGDAPVPAQASSVPSTSKLAVMDDDLCVSGPSGAAGAGGSSTAHPPGPHRPLGLTSFISGVKKVHAMKLENVVPGRLGGLHGAAGGAPAGIAAGTSGSGAGADGSAEEGGSALPSPTSPRGDGAAAGSEGGDAAAGPASPKPASDGATVSGSGGTTPSLLPLNGDGAPSSAAPSITTSAAAPKTVTLPRLGTLAGPGNPTVRLGSLRDGSLPTSGIGRLGAAAGVGPGGVGGRAGTAASLPAAVAPGGPQSAHARAMAARARAPSPEPAPRKEKKKTVSWAGDDALALYRLFKKDDPPQAAANDAVLTAEDEAAAAVGDGVFGGPTGPGGLGGLLPPPGFQSAARREHASERMALIAQHQQEEQERQQELERWAAMRPTVPWVEPPELYLGAISPQQLPALGEDSTEREVQARIRMHTPRTVYYSPSQIPPSPAEPPPEPEPDLYRVRHIPLNVPGGLQMGVGASGPGAGPPPHHAPPPHNMMQPPMYPGGPTAGPPPHAGLPLAMTYGGQVQPPHMPGAPQPGAPQPQGPPPPVQVQPGQPGPQPAPAPPMTLPPDIVASLPSLINSLSQPPGAPQPVPAGPQLQPAGPGHLPGHVPPGPGQLQPPPQGVLPPPPHPHQHPHPLPHPHARGPPPHGGSVPPQPGQPPLGPPGGPMVGPPGGPPMQYSIQQQQPPPHGGMGPGPGPGPGPAGMPPGPGPGRPGSRFDAGPGLGGPNQGSGAPPPPPPRKDGQPTVMRPRRGDEPPGGSGPGSVMPMGPAQHAHSHPHMPGPRGGRHGPPPHHMQGGSGAGGPAPHGMGGPGGGAGQGPAGGWGAAPGPGGGPPPGPGMSGPPPSSQHAPTSNKMCVFFNTPSGCRNGDSCRFLHVHPQDSGPPYDNGPYSGGPGRSGMGMGRPGAGPPSGLPGAMRRR